MADQYDQTPVTAPPFRLTAVLVYSAGEAGRDAHVRPVMIAR